MKIKSNRGFLTLPSAIVIAGALIAIALIYVNSPRKNAASSAKNTKDAYAVPAEIGLLPVSSEDHILGNPNAPIKFIEYSDLSCPYCKLFHPAMERMIAEYGPTGKVAWIYRQLPAYKEDSSGTILHPNSGVQAEALECAGALGGNKTLFTFLSRWFVNFPENGAGRSAAADKAALAAIAKEVGLNAISFNDCLASHRFAAKVEKDFSDGLASGATGTPYTFVLTPSGSTIPLEGIQTYAVLKNTIDTLIPTIKDSTTKDASTNI